MSEGHKWSGWPGAVCIKCGQPDMNEEALALDWIEMKGREVLTTDVGDVHLCDLDWKSEAHKEYVMHCNGSCPACMSIKEQEEYFEKARELRSKIDKLDEKNDFMGRMDVHAVVCPDCCGSGVDRKKRKRPCPVCCGSKKINVCDKCGKPLYLDQEDASGKHRLFDVCDCYLGVLF